MPFRKEGRAVARPVFGTDATAQKRDLRAVPEVSAYVQKLQLEFAQFGAQEHAYRHALKHLIEQLSDGVVAQNDPKADRGKRPDYVLRKKKVVVGYGEAKDLGVDLNKTEVSDQFQGYLAGLGGKFFLTDYLEFRFFLDSAKTATVRIGTLEKGKITLHPEAFAQLATEIRNFVEASGITITDPAELARLMALKTQLLRETVRSACEEDAAAGNTATELAEWRTAFAKVLMPNLPIAEFADMFAQTVTFGFFSARFNDTSIDTFTREEANNLIPRTNPFLRKFFNGIAGPDLDLRIVRAVEELVRLFQRTDVFAILDAFEGAKGKDPILYFYEDFLRIYDPKLKKARGVYYTPEAVVSYIVRSCDVLLQKTFGLAAGLADHARVGTDGPHRVQILDPAVGTGTFLNAVVERIASQFEGQEGLWAQYVEAHLLPRIHGFEILMAPYAVCHLKLSLALQERGYVPTEKRLGVYLTNSLEPELPEAETPFAKWLAEEANAASSIKRDVPVMLVLGNPPYNVKSKNKGKRILALLKDYKTGLNETNINSLSDDYIKFLRFAEDMVARTGQGIVAMITNNSFLDGITHRRMREHLRETFDEIFVLDLHGNSKRKETAPDGSKDENVFDIQQGVSIVFLVKTSASSPLATVRHAELFGKRDAKYAALEKEDVASMTWKELGASSPNHFFVPKSADSTKNNLHGVSLTDLFRLNASGIQTKRDLLFVDHSEDELCQRIEALLTGDYDDQFIDRYAIHDSSGYPLTRRIKTSRYSKKFVSLVAYRPFDTRKIYFDPSLLGRASLRVMQHLQAENISLSVTRQTNNGYRHAFVADGLTDLNSISLETREQSFAFPLYLYSFDQEGKPVSREPNFHPEVFKDIVQRLGFEPTPEQLFDYIYAVLHSPAYRLRYAEQLKIDFPRVPFTANRVLFDTLAVLGAELRELHLLTSPTLSKSSVKLLGPGNCVVEKPRYDVEALCVWINATQKFSNVPKLAWEHWIGGYQPAQKWLKDRKGRALSQDDVAHYANMIVALSETARLMGDVDVEIEKCGGWPMK